MVELDEARILEGVAPDEVRSIWGTAVEGIEEFGFGWGESVAHVWELVVDEACVEACDECAGEDGREDEESEGGDGAAERTEGWMVEFIGDECMCDGGRFAQPAGLAQDGEPREEHGGVACERGAEVCGEPVLAHARVAARCEEIVAKARFDHPPAEKALEADERGDAEEGGRRPGGYPSAGDEVD